MIRAISLICVAWLMTGCTTMLKYSPPKVISGNNMGLKVRAGIKAGHPGGVAEEHCRHYDKSAILSNDPLIDGFWTNTKIYRYECH